MTFELHNLFINAAKLDDIQQRVNHIHYYVYKLPESHRKMLEIIIRHLRIVADNCNENLMTVGNLGVCFGPTLLRPQEETMAAIMDIKFCNVVVEVLISNCQTIFNTPSPMHISLPCPPKPAHNILAASNGAQNAPIKAPNSASFRADPLPDGYVQNSAKSYSSSSVSGSSQSPGSGTQSSNASSAAAAAMIRQRQPPPPPKGVMSPYEKVPYESRSSDDLTVAVPSASSNVYASVAGNPNNRYQPPRIIEGGLSSRIGSNSDDKIGSSASGTPLNTIGTSHTLTRSKI